MNTKNIFSVFFLTTSFVTMSQTDIQYLSNKNGATLGYSTTSGVKILTIGGKHFKDLMISPFSKPNFSEFEPDFTSH